MGNKFFHSAILVFLINSVAFASSVTCSFNYYVQGEPAVREFTIDDNKQKNHYFVYHREEVQDDGTEVYQVLYVTLQADGQLGASVQNHKKQPPWTYLRLIASATASASQNFTLRTGEAVPGGVVVLTCKPVPTP